jgi:hypothetical protein
LWFRRSWVRFPLFTQKGPVPKWFKGVLCKSIIRQFESDRDLKY